MLQKKDKDSLYKFHHIPAKGCLNIKDIDDLKKIVNVLVKEWEDGIFQQLSNCKQYLKLDYKETKANLEKINLRLKEAKEETEQIKRNCRDIIKTYQESEEIKSNSPDQQVKKNRLNFDFRRQKIKTKKRYIQEL
ncbi:coiled-coil domain-containing protein 186-like [Mytilus edulis]|uniref:coiled-coil domain-containing protein 186-like n=1 Tax=Mytilus edulis TaxID=6550 RepID=UPI0039F0699B